MFLRISSITIAATLLASCAQEAEKPKGEKIACKLESNQELDEVCTLEVARRDGEAIMVVHHPDGSFRRLDADRETEALETMDGADQLKPGDKGFDETREYEVDGDRYLIPGDAFTRND